MHYNNNHGLLKTDSRIVRARPIGSVCRPRKNHDEDASPQNDKQKSGKDRFFNPAFSQPKTITTRTGTIFVEEIHKNVKNEDIEEFFQGNKLKHYLRRIICGKIPSQRHDLLKRGVKNFAVTSTIVQLSNITFLKEGDTDNKLIKICKGIYHNIVEENPEDGFDFTSNYVKYVLIPEGTIYFLMDKFGMNHKVAEEIYLNETYDSDSDEFLEEETSVKKIQEASPTEDNKEIPTEDNEEIPDLEDTEEINDLD